MTFRLDTQAARSPSPAETRRKLWNAVGLPGLFVFLSVFLLAPATKPPGDQR